MYETRNGRGSWQPSEPERFGPGKWTRVLLEAREDDAALPDADVQRARVRSAMQGAQDRGLYAWRRAEFGETSVDDKASAAGFALLNEVRGGERLPRDLELRLAEELGADLSRVRIHTGVRAAEICAALDARAVTVGDDVYFAPGTYDPTSPAGIELIAHEVAHVVQHQQGAPAGERRVSQPQDAHERAADAFAAHFIQPPRHAARPVVAPRVGSSPRETIDRKPDAASPDAMWQQMFHGGSVPVGKIAHVSAPKGIILKAEPSPGARKLSGIIPFDFQVFVERTTPQADVAQRWAYVVALSGGSGAGFIEEKFLALDPPEPAAKLRLVHRGDMLGAIASAEYGSKFEGGNDQRLYVQALYEANKNRPGIKLRDVDLSRIETLLREGAEEETLKIYRGVQIDTGAALWIPSDQFIQALKDSGQITSGSTDLSKAWRFAKKVGAAIVDGAEFLAGIFVGVLEGAWQALVDIFKGAIEMLKMAFEILKANLTGQLPELIVSTAKKIKDFFENVDFKAMAKALGKYIIERWENSGWFGRGEFVGQVVGYIAMNVLLAIATEGGSVGAVLAEAAEAGSELARAVMTMIKVVDAAQNPLKLLEGAGKGVTMSEEAAQKIKQGLAKEGQVAKQVEGGVQDAEKAVAKTEGAVPKKAGGKQGPEIKSGVAEPPDPLIRGGQLSERQLQLKAKLAAAAEKMIIIGKREVTATDLAVLTKETGLEHALVMLEDDTRALVQMPSYKGGRLPANTKRLLMHSHPDDWGSGMARFISKEDIESIVSLKQEYSYMVTVDGTVYKFTTKTIPMSIGDVVRELHPYHGWVGR
jgi:hypothetical protein